jgi:hypothetical protein
VNPHPASVIVPREAGLLHIGVRSTYILGLQIGSILSRLTAVALAKRSTAIKIEFFFASNVRNGWFFDIYIQGSKKIQL